MSNTAPEGAAATGLVGRLYDLATGEDEARLCRDIPDSQCREEPRGFVAQIVAQALSKSGDALADPRIVLPWLLGAVGAPAFFIGLLVPIRESLSLLPQILIGSVIRRFPVRKWFWIGASVVEGACIMSMGLVALAGMRGATAGWIIAGLLVLFSLARGVASIASKDTLGKTVSKGRRGRVGGYAGPVSGLVAGAVGLYLVLSPAAARPEGLFYALSVSPDLADSRFFFAVLLFILGISHAGVRIGRKTHIVDMAGPDRKAEYVALSNTLIGVLLLVIGAAVGVLMSIGLKFALIVLSVLALLGAATALAMRNVQE